MSYRLFFRIAAPTIAASLMLLAVGIAGAWRIYLLQQETSELLSRHLDTNRTVEILAIEVRELRTSLNRFLATGDDTHLSNVPQLFSSIGEALLRAEGRRVDPDERAQLYEVRHNLTALQQRYNELEERDFAGGRESAAAIVISELAANELRDATDATRDLLNLNESLVTETFNRNRHTTQLVFQGLALLGLCGLVAGLMAGYGITRGIRRSIMQLSVPIRDATGKLNEVVGPIQLATGSELEEVEVTLHALAEHVGAVVQDLQQSQREMLRREQLASIGQLAAGLAHELRNPLMSMKILVQSSLEEGPQARLEGRDLVVMDEEISRLERLINTFLDFARPPKPEKRRFDLRDECRQTLDLIAVQAERQQVSTELQTNSQPLTIVGDREQIRQVLLNLMLNALDVMPGGGRVCVAVQPEVTTTESDRRHAAQIVIRISDNGPGLPDELGERIFEPFVSTKETGAGLGLSICRRIVESHEGHITARNNVEGGATFEILLPAADAAP